MGLTLPLEARGQSTAGVPRAGKEVRFVMKLKVILLTLLVAVAALAHADGSTQKQSLAATVEAGHARRNLLSRRKGMLGDGSSAVYGFSRIRKAGKNAMKSVGKAVGKAAKGVKDIAVKTVTSAYKGATKVLGAATNALKDGVTHVHNKLTDKFGPNNDISWTEPPKGAKFGLALPGGGVKSIFAVWQIFTKYGGKIFSQAH